MGIGASQVSRARPGVIITLDALGTIFKFREPITTQYLKVAGRCGLKASIAEDDLKKAFGRSFKEISSEYPNYGKNQLKSPRAWWKTVVNDAFRQVVDEEEIPDHLGEELYDHFTSSAAYELYPDVKPFFASMRDLKAQYADTDDPPIFIGVISNSDPRVKSVLQSLGLRVGPEKIPRMETIRERVNRESVPDMDNVMKSVWFNSYNSLNDVDFLATSYEADAEKPSHQIFNFAGSLASLCYASKLEQSREDYKPSLDYFKFKWQVSRRIRDLENAQCIHIGDDYSKDYLGAESGGWDAIHLAREGEMESVEGATTVTNLEQAAAAVRIITKQYLSEKED